jgi:hypothetical protein
MSLEIYQLLLKPGSWGRFGKAADSLSISARINCIVAEFRCLRKRGGEYDHFLGEGTAIANHEDQKGCNGHAVEAHAARDTLLDGCDGS